MGGHGGLNILPQKRWNVYNFDNREKVRLDEEAAAKEEQLKREQSRKRDTEFRIEQLRQARGLASSSRAVTAESVPLHVAEQEPEAEKKSRHINLFEGIRIFDPVEIINKKREFGDEEKRNKAFKRMKKEVEKQKVVSPEDEKYRLGYGVAGKGVKLPWYIEKRSNDNVKRFENDNDDYSETVTTTKSSSSKKKSVEELREERLKREGREKERERALVQNKGRHQALLQNDTGRYLKRR